MWDTVAIILRSVVVLQEFMVQPRRDPFYAINFSKRSFVQVVVCVNLCPGGIRLKRVIVAYLEREELGP